MSDDEMLLGEEILGVIAQCIEESRPAIQADGGDIEFLGVNGQRVEVKLTGKCLTCALAGQTLGAIRRKILQRLDRPFMVAPIMA
jgi:Fe-S cluster biogenesis protein NfuA